MTIDLAADICEVRLAAASTLPPPPPPPDELAHRAAAVRQQAFAAVVAAVCHDHRAAKGEPCWVEPNPAAPGAGLGIGFLPGQDRPQVCARRRRKTLHREDDR